MKHALFDTDVCSASVAILIKETGFNSQHIRNEYILPTGLNPRSVVAFSLRYNEAGNCPATHAREYLSELLFELETLGITTILVADSKYFKFLTGQSKVDPHHGYVLDSKLKGYEDKFKVILIPNYQATAYNPAIQEKIDLGLDTLVNHLKGVYVEPGTDIIKSAFYPETVYDITLALRELLKHPELTVDIETVSLEFWNAGIATIAFAWNKHEGIAFAVDRGEHADKVKHLLKDFFRWYCNKCKLTGHNLSYDYKVLVYELWMKDLGDYHGMLEGIDILTKCFDDTKIISFLATNNAVRNTLDLKSLSAEFTGNYAQEDIKDTTKIPLPELLEYNLVDCLACWYVKEKYEPIMLEDMQGSVYKEIFIPSVKTLLATELFGMPILPDKVQIAKTKLTILADGYRKVLMDSHIIQEFHLLQQEAFMLKCTAKAKKKVFTLDDPKVVKFVFNPNSGPQLQELLFKYLGFPVLDKTKSKGPATGGKTLKKLIHHTTNQEYIDILEALIGLAQTGKILTSFIPAFENAQQLPDGSWRLYGNFNLGGTKTGRLSSSNPNLTNIPSHSLFAKLIKVCFGTIPGWIFGGADFNSLEDMVSALTTRDTNKIKVYTDGFDGHCLRAFTYFGDQMPDIVNTIDSINSIEHKYPVFRQDSKPITFMKTYGGTYHGLMKNLGFTKEKAIYIDNNYCDLYSESLEWVAIRVNQAKKDGYVTGAFGLRLRTPLLEAAGPKLTYKAESEGRTAGNMLGQSYCMLNARAGNEFMRRVWASKYRYDIFPTAQIHDACYFAWRDTIDIAHWVNKNLIECMQWCELNELKHDTVKLGAALDVFHPDWTNAIQIPNNAEKAQIRAICAKAVKELNQ
jgi:DNA polymerase-1